MDNKMTEYQCHHKIGDFCIERKADCYSDFHHCDIIRKELTNSGRLQTPPDSERIELGVDAGSYLEERK